MFGKAAAQHLAEHDPEFLALFERCAGEPDRLQRLGVYAQRVERATAPFAAVWTEGETALQVRDGAGVEPADVYAPPFK